MSSCGRGIRCTLRVAKRKARDDADRRSSESVQFKTLGKQVVLNTRIAIPQSKRVVRKFRQFIAARDRLATGSILRPESVGFSSDC